MSLIESIMQWHCHHTEEVGKTCVLRKLEITSSSVRKSLCTPAWIFLGKVMLDETLPRSSIHSDTQSSR